MKKLSSPNKRIKQKNFEFTKQKNQAKELIKNKQQEVEQDFSSLVFVRSN
jgi:hypothetical protein